MNQLGYMFAAFCVIWIALGAYLLWVAGLLRRTRRDVEALSAELDERMDSSRPDVGEAMSARGASPTPRIS